MRKFPHSLCIFSQPNFQAATSCATLSKSTRGKKDKEKWGRREYWWHDRARRCRRPRIEPICKFLDNNTIVSMTMKVSFILLSILLLPRSLPTALLFIFVQRGLSPPEFCCAFLKVQKVPSWNERSAPLTKNKRPPDKEKAPPWKGGSTHKFPAAHQKCYMGHSVIDRRKGKQNISGIN